MSQKLAESGIEAKTGANFPHGDQYVLLDSNEVPMANAMLEISNLFRDPTLLEDGIFQSYIDVLKTMYPKEADGDQLYGMQWLSPTPYNYPPYRVGEDPGPSTDIMGHTLSRNDIIDFTFYVFTNTSIEGTNDPRLAFLNRLRVGLFEGPSSEQNWTRINWQTIRHNALEAVKKEGKIPYAMPEWGYVEAGVSAVIGQVAGRITLAVWEEPKPETPSTEQ